MLDTYNLLTVCVPFALVPTPPVVPAAQWNGMSGLKKMRAKVKRDKATPERLKEVAVVWAKLNVVGLQGH